MPAIFSDKPKFKRHVRKSKFVFDWPRLTDARRLDLIADFELSCGRTLQAERLANAAVAIREAGR
jgi:hypothetical protein